MAPNWLQRPNLLAETQKSEEKNSLKKNNKLSLSCAYHPLPTPTHRGLVLKKKFLFCFVLILVRIDMHVTSLFSRYWTPTTRRGHFTSLSPIHLCVWSRLSEQFASWPLPGLQESKLLEFQGSDVGIFTLWVMGETQ